MQTLEAPPACQPPDGCSGCVRFSDPAFSKVVLLSGATVCTWCEAWRLECFEREKEARWVLRMSDKPTRVAHLAKREAQFGAEYRRRLEAVILGLWERRRAAAAASTGES